MCKSVRGAKERKSVCDGKNKEAIKRESVRDVTTRDETISDSCYLQWRRNKLLWLHTQSGN